MHKKNAIIMSVTNVGDLICWQKSLEKFNKIPDTHH